MPDQRSSAMAIFLGAIAGVAVRARLQTAIDRRLYRARFDAQPAAARFGTTIRGLAAVDEITHELGTVLGRTLQPSAVGIWLTQATETSTHQSEHGEP